MCSTRTLFDFRVSIFVCWGIIGLLGLVFGFLWGLVSPLFLFSLLFRFMGGVPFLGTVVSVSIGD